MMHSHRRDAPCDGSSGPSRRLLGAVLSLGMGALLLGLGSTTGHAQEVEISPPRVALQGIPFDVTIKGELPADQTLTLRAGERTYEVTPSGEAETTVEGVVLSTDGPLSLEDAGGQTVASAEADVIPGWFAILPSVIAIGLALALR
jgi:hypothetical protein